MRREKMNNKGFSLVELIIVIAIMAILSAALAPQLMKYIEKSRVSTDSSSCASIESCVNAALAEEAVYKEVAAKGATTNIVMNITVPENGKLTSSCFSVTVPTGGGATNPLPKLTDELCSSLASLKAPKQTGMTVYVVEIQTSQNSNTTATGSTTTEVGKVKVYTKSNPQTTSTITSTNAPTTP